MLAQGDGRLSVKKRTSSRRVTAATARETAKRFGLRLQGAAREGVVIVLLVACVFLLLALYSFRAEDPGWSRSGPETEVANWMGPVGAWLADVLYSLFGVSALWWPGMLGFAAWWLIRSRQVRFEWDATALAVRCGGLVLLLLGSTALGALHFYHPESPLPYSTGGILGEGLVGALLPLVGAGGTGLLALAALLCGMPLFTGLSWLTVMDELGHRSLRLWRWVADRFGLLRERQVERREQASEPPVAKPAAHQANPAVGDAARRVGWWQRLRDARRRRAVAAPAARARTAPRQEPGLGDDGTTEIPWEVAERTPSAKTPGAAYTAQAASPAAAPEPRREPHFAPAAPSDEPSEEATPSGEPSRTEVPPAAPPSAPASPDATPDAEAAAFRPSEPRPAPAPDEPASRQAPSHAQRDDTRRVPETVPDPVLPDDDEVPAWQGPALRAPRDEGLAAASTRETPAARGAEPSVAPQASPPSPHPERGDAAARDDTAHGGLTGAPAAPEARHTASDEPVAAADHAEPAAPSTTAWSSSDASPPRVATAEQAQQAADAPDGPALWTVEHLQNQRPVFDELPEPDGELPSLRLLTPPQPQQRNYSEQQLAEMAELLEMRLREYGVKAEVVDTWPGPVITRFEIKPAAGVKVSKISNLAKDLARSLMVKSVRVVEVIPGRPTVGIEIPNPHRAMIRLREVIDSDRYKQEASALTLALGQDIGGGPVVSNLGKMPHLLVAGTTGSGKSVGVNAMLISMLLKATPDELRMIMVDPKMLELSVYDGIPHLLAPVVTDMKEAANALRWCVAEMERRYKLMASMGVRNIAGFNGKLDEAEQAGAQVADPLWEPQPWEMHQAPPVLEKLPYIVVVIDEFADMFMIVGKKVEELIARLAQKARAAGIHLILATQRPSVDVVTGLIKANIPTRMAFQVSSRVDSRTILDQGGAENLLGHGDMLYLPAGSGMPTRVHGAFVDDDEVHRVVEDWKRRGEPEYIDEILSGGVSAEALAGLEAEGGGDDDAEQDALYDEAVAFVTESRRASISAVQRRFKIGYNRAARLVESMEMAGVVSTMGTNGARDVLAPPPVGD